MNLGQIYDLVVDQGIKASPRNGKLVKEDLKDLKKEFDKMSKEKKEEFDLETLTNPFADTRLLYGERKREVKCMLVGVDMEVPELLLANELNKTRKKKIDVVIAHHPEGVGLAGLADVMDLQVDVMSGLGIPVNVVEKLMEPRIAKIRRAIAPSNQQRGVDAARLLDLPYACFHTVADNQVHNFLETLMEKKQPKKVGDIIKILKEIPEYKEAVKLKQGPVIFAGNEKSRCGKVAITGMTGGTEGSDAIYEKLSAAGVGTIIDMHISEGNREKAEKYQLNVIVAGHMASDSLGLNLLMDKIEKKGVEVIATSGYIRVKR